MSKFKPGDIITNFRAKPSYYPLTKQWIDYECKTWLITGINLKTITGPTYNVKSLDKLTATDLKSYDSWIEIYRTDHDYELWDAKKVQDIYELMKIAIEEEIVNEEIKRIQKEKEDKERSEESDETIKKYFDDGYEAWKGGPKKRSINRTAEYFKRELKYVWDLIEKMSGIESSENDNNYGLEDANDYSDVREELFGPENWEIREYFDKNKSIRKLASQYFDDDLEKAWEFIEDYDGRTDGLEGARDYDIVYEALFPDDSDDDDENN
jgi:hypothetical protein